jgi:putative flippase GtrA
MITFLKAQMSSIIGSAADFLLTILLVEFGLAGPVAASVAGSVCGGILNFSINRELVFADGEKGTYTQLFRYALVWTGSLTLNALGLYIATRMTNVNYVVAKTIISIAVGISFNYFLQKKFVFK